MMSISAIDVGTRPVGLPDVPSDEVVATRARAAGKTGSAKNEAQAGVVMLGRDRAVGRIGDRCRSSPRCSCAWMASRGGRLISSLQAARKSSRSPTRLAPRTNRHQDQVVRPRGRRAGSSWRARPSTPVRFQSCSHRSAAELPRGGVRGPAARSAPDGRLAADPARCRDRRGGPKPRRANPRAGRERRAEPGPGDLAVHASRFNRRRGAPVEEVSTVPVTRACSRLGRIARRRPLPPRVADSRGRYDASCRSSACCHSPRDGARQGVTCLRARGRRPESM